MSDGRRYRIVGPIGRGGFGTVYRAEMLGEGDFVRPVALKVLNPDMDGVDEVARRFRDEARVLGLIRHRAIVQVDGLVRLEGRWAVVMELVDGVDLRTIVHEAPAMPPGAALEIVGEAGAALHAAYNRNGPDGRALRLLHRDIKPANIHLTPEGEVKILDFGIARADFGTREAQTRSLMFGTVEDMSPERLDFVDGPAGDVYALGAVLYELLTREKFGRTSAKVDRHQARLTEAMDRVWQATEGKSETLVRFVGELMAYEPEDRPLARDVERRCSVLRDEVAGERLVDWAERVVPPIVARKPAVEGDDFSGSIVIEQSGELSGPRPREVAPTRWEAPAKAPGPATRGVPAFVLAASAIAGLLLLAGVGVAGWLLSRTEPPLVQPELSAAAVATEPIVPPEPVEAPPPPEPEPAPAPRLVPKRAPVVAAPAPVAPSTATVRVTGDARAVTLVQGSKRRPPGEVPPGAYTVEADFGAGAVLAGNVTAAAGQSVTLRCVAAFTRCAP